MRVLLADGRELVRFALHILLGLEAELVLVGDVGDARSLLTAIHTTRPDVLLLDWELPDLVGPRMLATLRTDFPDLKVIVLSCELGNKHLVLLSGADAFVSKIEPPDRLLALLRRMASDRAAHLEPEPSGATGVR
jgi:two-component system response regulator DesR